MRSYRKERSFAAAAAVAAIAASSNAPLARADKPVDWCPTHENWVAKVGVIAGQGSTCPTLGDCDTPSVRDSWIPQSADPVVRIRLRFHIFCNDSGAPSTCAATSTAVTAQMAQLNSDFAPWNIGFSYTSEFVNETDYRSFADSEETAMKNMYADSPATQLNVYVVNIEAGYLGVGTLAWDPDALANLGGIIVDDNWFGAGQKTLTHEVGHCLGLWHTHHGVSEPDDGIPTCSWTCYERADGTDADTTGDFAADTAPTPTNYYCVPPGGTDCFGVSWGPTDPQNYMGYAPDDCYEEFTAQQAGRMHCWIKDALTDWIQCSSAAECDSGCGVPSCSGFNCSYTVASAEQPASTCRDGFDNDCDGQRDCQDADCASDPECFTPLVRVEWDGPLPPAHGQDFFIDADTEPNNPNVAFRTGNDGWRVWSQISATDATPANLGHITIDPTLPTANFTLTIANGALPGAAKVKSIDLTKEGEWSGHSNLSGGIIAGDLEGALRLQRSAAFEGGELTGSVYVQGAVDGNILVYGIASTGELRLGQLDHALTVAGSHAGVIRVDGDMAESASISAYDSTGQIQLGDNASTDIAGDITILGYLTGPFNVPGTFSGNLCAGNLDPSRALPVNVQIRYIGPEASVCGVSEVSCPNPAAPTAEPGGVPKNRFLSFVPGNNGVQTAIAVYMDSLHHPPTPDNPPDFSNFEGQVRYVNAFRDAADNPVFTCTDSTSFGTSYKCAKLGCEPEYRDWGQVVGPTTVLHVTSPEVVPSSTYSAYLIRQSCSTESWASFSSGVLVETALWGDLDDSGSLDVLDISTAVDKVKDLAYALREFRVLLQNNSAEPDQPVNVLDIVFVVDALRNFPYRFPGPGACN